MTKSKAQKITKAKGRPFLNWVGKRGIEVIDGFPAQLAETFDPAKEINGKNWTNLIFYGDNKEVCGHLLEKHRGKVDLIYIDPPFDSKADYIRKVELRGLKGKKVEGEGQSAIEQVQYEDLWSNDEYLQFMFERLMLLSELLSPTGSIYLHCDWHQSHHLRCLMDEVFGSGNFVSEIAWCYRFYEHSKTSWNKKHDNLFLYSKNKDRHTFNWENVALELEKSSYDKFKHKDKNERRFCIRGKNIKESPVKQMVNLPLDSEKKYPNLTYRQYMDEIIGVKPRDWFLADILVQGNPEILNYPTQKPEKLLERIISASSNPGDLILDLFAGSGTTAAVAQKLGRRWIICDINHGAIQTSSKRLQKIIQNQIAEPPQLEKTEKENKPAALNFQIQRVNNYDLQIQHNEALELAIEKMGVERTPKDGFFDGLLGEKLVKIIPLQRAATIADLSAIEREIHDFRSEETRNIEIVALGAETDTKTWIAEMNQKNKPSGFNQYYLTDLRETGFFEHKNDEAKISFQNKNSKITISIDDFHSPTIIERLGIENKKSDIKASIPDFRSQIDCVSIDFNFDGKDFKIDFSDIPEKKKDLISGKYEFDTKNCGKKIAVKIIDMLGEEVLAILET